MNNQIHISVITVNYNGLSDTKQMIESIAMLKPDNIELIVVDNGSKEDEAAVIRKEYPWVISVRSDLNRGFAGGNNIGLKYATGDYLFFLNNDTEITEETFTPLVARLQSDEKIGGVSPKIKYYHNPEIIQYAGYSNLSTVTLRNKTIGIGMQDSDEFNVPHETAYLHGAAFMIKREVLDTVGPMSEVFFLYYEEFDWCERMRQSGYKLWYEPNSTVYHKESATVGLDSPVKVFYMTRNRLLYAFMHRSYIIALLSLIYQVCFAVNKQIIVYLFKRRFSLVKSTVKGVCEFFKMPWNTF